MQVTGLQVAGMQLEITNITGWFIMSKLESKCD